MKSPKSLCCFLLALVTASAIAAESRTPAAPQSRPRLDPEVRNAPPPAPASAAQPAPPADTLTMARFVVRDRVVTARQPAQLPQPTETFTPANGGAMIRRDAGRMRLEAGAWPSVDVLAEDSRFKGQKTRVDVDVVRVTW